MYRRWITLQILDETVKLTLKDAAQKLTGPKKRAFMAKLAEDYFGGSARTAETKLGWSHRVQLGLHEQRCGVTCLDNYQARGHKKTDVNRPTANTQYPRRLFTHGVATAQTSGGGGYS